MVDREQQAQGFFYRVWRNLTLRGLATRRSLQSLRQALEQEALLAYAAIAAGANAPKLIATSELGPDAVMLVYEHTGGRTLDSLPDELITDALLRDTWHQVQALQSRRIAHRRLAGDAILVDRSGTVILTDLRGGEIAAGDLLLRMDIAQLLTTLGLRVGAERTVASAVGVLGPDAIADCLPLLQPIALTRSTRATLRKLARERAQRERDAVLEASRQDKLARAEQAQHAETGTEKPGKKAVRAEQRAEKRAIDEALDEAREEDLLTQIRHQVLRIRPQAPVEPARLERVRPRTLISFIAGAIGGYFLLTQLTHIEFATLFDDAQWGWVAAAVLFSALSYFAAAMALLGFVPERVPFMRAVAAQVAGSFVKIVAPAAVGGVALNTRFLQRAGVRPGLAVASVGASQLFGLGCHILMLLSFGYLTGTEKTPSLSPSRTVIAGLLTVAVLVLVVTSVPFLRKFVVTRVRSLFAGVVPRMLDVLQRPQEADHGHRRHAAADRLLRDVPGRVDPRLRQRPDHHAQPRQRRRRLPRRQRARLRGADPRRRRRGRGHPDGRSDRRRTPQGGRRPRGAAVPAADPVAAGAAGLAVLQPPDTQGRALEPHTGLWSGTRARTSPRAPLTRTARAPSGPPCATAGWEACRTRPSWAPLPSPSPPLCCPAR